MSFKEPDEEKALQEFKYLYGYSNIFPFNLFHSYDDKQNNLLRYCVRTNNPDCVQKLLPYVDPSRPGNEALKLACENNFYVIVSILLQDGRSDPASYRDDNYCIRIASEKGFTNTVALLLADGRADPNKGLEIACEQGHIEVVKLLLNDTRTDPNRGIQIACKEKQIEIVKLLLKSPQTNPNYGIYDAIQSKSVQLVQLLLQDSRIDFSKISLYSDAPKELKDLIYLDPRFPDTKITLNYIFQQLETNMSLDLIEKVKQLSSRIPNGYDVVMAYVIRFNKFSKNIRKDLYDLILFLLAHDANPKLLLEYVNENNIDLLSNIVNLPNINIFPFLQRIFIIFIKIIQYNVQQLTVVVQKFVSYIENNESIMKYFLRKYTERNKLIDQFFDSISQFETYKDVILDKENIYTLFYFDIFQQLKTFITKKGTLFDNSSIVLFSNKLKQFQVSPSSKGIITQMLDDPLILQNPVLHFIDGPSLFRTLKNYVILKEITIVPTVKCSYDRNRKEVQEQSNQYFAELNIFWPLYGAIRMDEKKGNNIFEPFAVKEYTAPGPDIVYYRIRINESVLNTVQQYIGTNQIIYLDIIQPGHIYGCLIYMQNQVLITLNTGVSKDYYDNELKYLYNLIFNGSNASNAASLVEIYKSFSMSYTVPVEPSNKIFIFPLDEDIDIQKYDDIVFSYGQCLDWNLLLATEFVKEFASFTANENFIKRVNNFYTQFQNKFTLNTLEKYQEYKQALANIGLQGGRKRLNN